MVGRACGIFFLSFIITFIGIIDKLNNKFTIFILKVYYEGQFWFLCSAILITLFWK